jgi:hypothetical protein
MPLVDICRAAAELFHVEPSFKYTVVKLMTAGPKIFIPRKSQTPGNCLAVYRFIQKSAE